MTNAENVQATRAEIAKSYTDQLVSAGWTEKQAYQYGQVLAANAEQMAPIFNLTPQEYLKQNFAGYTKMTQADFETGNIRGLFQAKEIEWLENDEIDDNGLVIRSDHTPVDVIEIPEGSISEITDPNEFRDWVMAMLAEGGNIDIEDTGKTLRFTNKNTKDSYKRARNEEHRNAYFALRKMIQKAKYSGYVAADERHPTSGGQELYHSSFRYKGKLYRVLIKQDVISDTQRETEKRHGRTTYADLTYKDHHAIEIDIASALSQTGPNIEGDHLQGKTDAINKVSLGVLRGAVKPTKIEGNVLRQNSPIAVRGAMSTITDGRHFVALFESQDASTVLHETAHYFLEQLREAHALADAPEWVNEAWQKLEKAYGFSEWIVDREGWVNVQELFALECEAYCRDGKDECGKRAGDPRRNRQTI